jgi:hypothetical protein
MEKTRAVIKTYSRWEDLQIYPQRIEAFLESDFVSAIENGKALIEAICKTILTEQGKPCGENDKVHRLVRNTLQALGILSSAQISRFGSGLMTALQNLGELRNLIGDTSHGRSTEEMRRNKIETLSARFLIDSVEIIACFLVEYYELEFPKKKLSKKDVTIDYQPFDDYLDETYGRVKIATYEFLPSDILANLDSVAYQSEYKKFLDLQNETDGK